MTRVLFLSGLILSLSAACSPRSLSESALADNPAPQKSRGAGWNFTRPFTPGIPAGTNVRVRLLETITSRSAAVGKQFEAELLAPIKIAGNLVFPRSTRLRGHVAEARRCSRTSAQGFLRITLDAIQKLDGAWVDVDTTSVSVRGNGPGSGPPPGSGRRPMLGRPDLASLSLSEAIISTDRKLQFAVLQRVVMSR